MAVGAVLLSFLASSSCAVYACLLEDIGATTVLALYSATGSSSLMALMLTQGLRWRDFR